jgi:ParB family chromosome partitioning protein
MKRRALGKGIEAIISNKGSSELENNYIEIDIENIYPNPFQPRKKFNIEKIKELASSIKETGMIQPIIVYKKAGKFHLIVGERRWRAVRYLKWKKIPAIIKDISTDNVMIGALVENIQREDLNAIEIKNRT